MHETSNEVCDLEISQIVSVFAVAGFVTLFFFHALHWEGKLGN